MVTQYIAGSYLLRVVVELAVRMAVNDEYIGPATRCDAAHLRWEVLKPLRCSKIASDGLRSIFQHVGNFAPDFGIPQLFIVRFSNGLQHYDGHSISFHVICE